MILNIFVVLLVIFFGVPILGASLAVFASFWCALYFDLRDWWLS